MAGTMTRTPDQVPQQAEIQDEIQAEQPDSLHGTHSGGLHGTHSGGLHDAQPGEPPLRADARQNRARLIAAATEAFAEKGAGAPLEDVARRAGVGIGTLYRHFPNRLDLQAAVFRSQVVSICGQGDTLLESVEPEQAFAGWCQALAAYLITKRGLSKALIEAVGMESELMKSCWMAMRDTTERLLTAGQQAGKIRSDVDSMDVMRLVHGVAVATERDPERAGLLLSVTLDGLRAKPA
jgi:AcrR family transcriptional regulator